MVSMGELSDSLKKKLSEIHWLESRAARVLIVDDEVRMVQEVRRLLEEDGYTVQVASNGRSALEMIKESPPDLIMSDVAIRFVTGFDLCRYVKQDPHTKNIPFILVTGLVRPDDKIKGIQVGANDFIAKPFDSTELKVRVKSAFHMKELASRLTDFDDVIFAFSRAVEARDPYTRGHSERVGKYAMRIASAMGLNDDFQNMLFKGAVLHDIGKIGVPDAILRKDGRLTDEEFAWIKKHPEIGLEICAPLKSSRPLLNMIAYHHEKIDGSGYPYGLIGSTIPAESRIMAVADTFDALTSDRPYRKAMGTKEAVQIMARGADTHLDEDFLGVFMEISLRGEVEDIKQIAHESQDHLSPIKEINGQSNDLQELIVESDVLFGQDEKQAR